QRRRRDLRGRGGGRHRGGRPGGAGRDRRRSCTAGAGGLRRGEPAPGTERGGAMSAAGTVLDRIVAETRQAGPHKRVERPLQEPSGEARPAGQPGRFHAALAAPGIGVIAEFKRRSPSAGSLHDAPDIESIVGAYERGGAVAASILTEEPNFGGALSDLLS